LVALISPKIRLEYLPSSHTVYSCLVKNNTNRFVAKIFSKRVNNPFMALKLINLELSSLSSPFLLKDMKKASNRIVKAILFCEVIGIETDHDCDGQTAHAILYEALSKSFNHPPIRIRSYIGHRIREGYGLSPSLTNRILSDSIRPTLLITADNGSNDEKQIALLKKNGIETIVTDHHVISKYGIPNSAHAVVNPMQN